MGRRRFLSLLLVSLFVALLSTHASGYGRKMTETVHLGVSEVGESGRKLREMAEIMDYSDPGPNTNKNGGYTPSLP